MNSTKNFRVGQVKSEVRIAPLPVAEKCGYIAAVIFGQIGFWSRHTKYNIDGLPVFHKSLREWAKEFPGLSEGTIHAAIERLRSEGLVLVSRGVIPGVHRSKSCYSLNPNNPLVQDCFNFRSESERNYSESERNYSESERNYSESEQKNAGSLTAPTVPGPLRASESFKRSHSSGLLPDWRILKPKTEAWLAALDEKERLAVNIAVDREIEERGSSIRNHVALRIYVLWDFMRGDREMPEISADQYSMIGAFKKLFDGGDEAVPAVKMDEPKPIQPEVPTYDEEMQAEYAQQFEIMEESHVCH